MDNIKWDLNEEAPTPLASKETLAVLLVRNKGAVEQIVEIVDIGEIVRFCGWAHGDGRWAAEKPPAKGSAITIGGYV